MSPVRERYYPELKEEAIEEYPECSRELAERKLINDKLHELRRLARFYLTELLTYIQNIDECPMYTTLMETSGQIQRSSGVSQAVAVREAVRLYKEDLNKFLIEDKNEDELIDDNNDSDIGEEAFDVRMCEL